MPITIGTRLAGAMGSFGRGLRSAAAGRRQIPRGAKRAMIGTGIGALGIAGFAKGLGSTPIDAGMEVAFGDPQADRSILGTDLTPSMVYMASGLPGSTAIGRTMNISRTGYDMGGGGALTTVAAAGAVGSAAGGFGAYKLASRAGRFGRLAGGMGAAVGAGIGAIAGAGAVAASIRGPLVNNRQIMNESPFYNQSLLTAQRLNASGNIVLGMHNSRRG